MARSNSKDVALAEHPVDLRFIERFEAGVVAVRQWPTARHDLPGRVVANRLELPPAAYPFEIANVLADVGVDLADASANLVKP